MKIIALDDEPLALKIIEKYVQNDTRLQFIQTFTSAREVLQYVSKHDVDLLISDINMPDINGLDFVAKLGGFSNKPMVILLTAYKEHALQGFDLEVVDYLVKPVEQSRFKKAIDRAYELYQLKQVPNPASSSSSIEHFMVYSEYQQIKIIVKDILYIESMGDYVKIYLETQDKPILSLNRLKNLAELLQDTKIQRIHRSYLINEEKITATQKSRLKIKDQWLPISVKAR